MDVSPKRLDGVRVLVVEDVAVLAWQIRDVLAEAGAEVVGPAPNVDRALALLQERAVDAAVLDKSLDGASSDPVADLLRSNNTPFLFLTGYGSGERGGRYGKCLTVSKPVTATVLIASVASIMQRAA